MMSFRKYFVAAAVFAAGIAFAAAAPPAVSGGFVARPVSGNTTYRDAQGRYAGSATVNGNMTTYRDAQGRFSGTATRSGNTVTYRDAQGRFSGSATVNGNTTTYRDAQGRYVGTQR